MSSVKKKTLGININYTNININYINIYKQSRWPHKGLIPKSETPAFISHTLHGSQTKTEFRGNVFSSSGEET